MLTTPPHTTTVYARGLTPHGYARARTVETPRAAMDLSGTAR